MSVTAEPAVRKAACHGCGVDLTNKARRKNRDNGHYLCPSCYERTRENRRRRDARKKAVVRLLWFVVLIAIGLVATIVAVKLRSPGGTTSL